MEKYETIILAGGCFWCTEAIFQSLAGVISVVPGYSGGTIDNPTYLAVASKKTGHAEAIKIQYDPTILNTRDLFEVFFDLHDPTTKDQQENDKGPEYRSAIFYMNEEQKKIAEEVIEEVNKGLPDGKTVVTELALAGKFYPAEAEHQNFYKKNPNEMYCQIIISPKLDKLKKKHADKLA